jgi:hypothetical protein
LGNQKHNLKYIYQIKTMPNLNKRIVDLPLILANDISSLDVLPIVNVEADVTNKVTIGELANYFDSSDTFLTGVTYNTLEDNLTLSLNNGTSLSADIPRYNRWFIPSGQTYIIENNFQSFIYGDLIVEGTLDLEPEGQLIVLNGNIILSGGSIIGSGTTYLIDLPENDIYVTSGTFNPGTKLITFSGNTGFVPFNVDLSSLSTDNFYTTGATLNGTIVEFNRNDLTNAYSVDLAPLKFTGNSLSECISDIYVSNLHACSPLNINPGDEGNVNFGSTNQVSIELPSGKVVTQDLQIVNGANSGYVLTSDISGNASWQAPFNTNLYNSDGTLTTNRVVNLDGKTLSFSGSQGEVIINSPSDLKVKGVGSAKPVFSIDGDANTDKFFKIQSSSVSRWEFLTRSDELGGNSGTNLKLARFDDSGAFLNYVLEFDRATGVVRFNEAYSFPTTDGSTNQVLTTNGSGNVSWQTPSTDTNIYNTNGTLTANRTVNLDGKTLSFLSGNTTFSSNTSNVLTIVGSGATTPIFTIQGSSGELFSVSDSLIGSLFSVNDISGLPVLEAFSDNTILMGSYQAPSLNTTIKRTANAGTTTIYSIPTSAYTGAFFDYTVNDGTNLRAGNIMSIWSGTSVNFTETTTTDFGNTSGITFNMVVSSGNAILETSAVTSNWVVKTIVRSI